MMKINPQHHHAQGHNTLILTIIVMVSAILGYIIISMNSKLHSDEVFHANQIWLFYEGQNSLVGNITVPPTYHFVIGKIVQLTGGYHDNLLRLISLCIALLTIPLVYFTAKYYDNISAWEKTLQVYFTPLIFPYFFLLYTDIWSLCSIVATMLLALHRHFIWAGLVGGLAIVIRQDNIAWVGLIYLFICFEFINHFNKANAARLILNALTKGAIFNVVFIGFLVFVYINGGVAIGDADSHKLSSFNLSNLHVFLICCWALFLPTHINQIPNILPLLRKPIAIFLLTLGFFIYVGTLKNIHPYNTLMHEYFLHNGLVYLLTEFPAIKVASYFLAAWAFLSLMTIDLPDWRWRWVIMLSPVAAICHPLIEPRYYIPAFFLIHVLRKKTHQKFEFLTLSVYVLICAYFMYGITKEAFFL